MNRLDKELHLRKMTKSRTAAAELISSGKVAVNGVVCVKLSQEVTPDDEINIIGEALPLKYVSRGGLKLEHALRTFDIDLSGKLCLDVGASTGGFTDCMLKHGAHSVYAVDVGTSQLAAELRQDERVISMENCDIRTAKFPVKFDFTAVDVSFISLKLILPFIKNEAVVLIKPQFELGKRHKGVITDKKVQAQIAADITAFAKETGFEVKGITDSPAMSKAGSGEKNREFLMWVTKKEVCS